MLTLFTHRYQEFRPAQGVPVRITAGAPRFSLSYSLTHAVRELAPRREYLRMAYGQFVAAYRADLNQHGEMRIGSLLEAISSAEGDPRLVLLCFEDLSVPGQWCHRRVFAEWWQERTGDEVRELGPMSGQQSLL